jgi:endonuclease YncB( thermonuclease family)
MSDRERLRDLIRAELAKHRPRESARASLELLAESSIMIESGCDTERASGGNEVWSEDAVRRAIDELRRKHPLLFREVKEESHEALDKSPAAAPDHSLLDPPAAPAKPQRDWLFLEQGIFERQAHDGLEPLAPAAAAPSSPLWTSYGNRPKELMSALGRWVRVSRNSPDGGKSAARPAIQPKRPRPPGRYVYAALAAIFTLFVWVGFWAALKPKLGSGYTSVAERTRTPSEAREQKETSALSGQPANGDRTWPAGSQPQGKLKGTPEVIDTATIRLEGKVVRLFGVEWVRGSQAEELAGYLRGREVECELASTPDRYRCQVGGHDLSRAVLFNGGGRATGGAPPELVEAENNAKAARRGVWQR